VAPKFFSIAVVALTSSLLFAGFTALGTQAHIARPSAAPERIVWQGLSTFQTWQTPTTPLSEPQWPASASYAPGLYLIAHPPSKPPAWVRLFDMMTQLQVPLGWTPRRLRFCIYRVPTAGIQAIKIVQIRGVKPHFVSFQRPLASEPLSGCFDTAPFKVNPAKGPINVYLTQIFGQTTDPTIYLYSFGMWLAPS
jgi:hypothetical protein